MYFISHAFSLNIIMTQENKYQFIQCQTLKYIPIVLIISGCRRLYWLEFWQETEGTLQRSD